jgi:hypothetical protein
MAQGKTIPDMVKATKDLINTKHAGHAEALVRTATATVQSAAQKKYFDNAFAATNHSTPRSSRYRAQQKVKVLSGQEHWPVRSRR